MIKKVFLMILLIFQKKMISKKIKFNFININNNKNIKIF